MLTNIFMIFLLVNTVFLTFFVRGLFQEHRPHASQTPAFWYLWMATDIALVITCLLLGSLTINIFVGLPFAVASISSFRTARLLQIKRQRASEWQFIEAAWKPVTMERIREGRLMQRLNGLTYVPTPPEHSPLLSNLYLDPNGNGKTELEYNRKK